MLRTRLERSVPLGINYGAELKWLAFGFVAALLGSLSFFAAYANHYQMLFQWRTELLKVLRPGAVMPDFVDILGASLIGFLILAVCMIGMLIYHVAYHYQGSRSIYLMRRLPRRRELWRRCLALPAAAAAASLCAAFLLLLLYYWYYMARTPDACLTPDQWEKIRHVLLGAAL